MKNDNATYLAESGASCCSSLPLWVSPKFRALIAERLWEVCAQEGWDNNRTGAVLVGRGAERMAQELNLMGAVAEVVSARAETEAEVDHWVVLPLEAVSGVQEWPQDWSVEQPLTSDPRIGGVMKDVEAYAHFLELRQRARMRAVVTRHRELAIA